MKHIAIDLGAESGRVMLGTIEAGRLTLEELHRFPSSRSFVAGHWRWDVLAMLEAIREGISKAPADAASLSCDSWGVDYALLKQGHPYLTPPFMYRDPRTDAIFEKALANPAEKKLVFEESGLQFLHFNTLWPLSDDRQLHEVADGFLQIGDYFNHLLGGRAVSERSLASTSQIYDPRSHQWSDALIKHYALKKSLFPEIVASGTVIGEVDGRKIVATCSHDTGCAVAAAPLMDETCCYLSSGTWSLLGAELSEPVINDQARELNFTNEIGYGPDGKACVRFLKNLSGLFILQECRKAWVELSYADLAKQADAAEPLRTLIRPDAPQFGRLGDMPKAIEDYCRKTGQPVPQTPGQFARCVYESLAMLYRKTIGDLENLSGRQFKMIHIVGGGSQAQLLNQLTADLTGRTVQAGPVEATAAGNVLIQAAALGHIQPNEIRSIVRQSFDLQTYKPAVDTGSEAAFQRFLQLPQS